MDALQPLELALTQFLRNGEKDSFFEKTWLQLERLTGIKRERLVVAVPFISLMFLVVSRGLPEVASYILCILFPLWKYINVVPLSPRSNSYRNEMLLRYWNAFAIMSLLDFTRCASYFHYYTMKTLLFGMLIVGEILLEGDTNHVRENFEKEIKGKIRKEMSKVADEVAEIESL